MTPNIPGPLLKPDVRGRCTLAHLVAVFVFLGALCPLAVAQVQVSISPSLVTAATLATQQFTAIVAGSTDTAVTWKVNGVAGGDSTYGVVSTAGLYLSPANVPSEVTFSVTAVSEADPTKSASATVSIQEPSRSGITFYVATTGNDSNAGTLRTPWRTIQHAANSVHPGDTVQVLGGVYNESVTIPTSGDATAGYITLQNYAGQAAVLDGTGLRIGNGQQFGLFTLRNNSYLVIKGFEIRNFQSATKNAVPVGIDFEGSGSYVEILNNHIHNIVHTLATCGTANALGMAIYGNRAPASISNLTISGNELDHNTTGCSENISLDGNVQYFVVANNLVHDDNNIGIDNIGFEGVSPNASYDQARDGWNFQNTIYNISSAMNPVYHGELGASGQYCDGCARVIIERNLIHDTDIPIEIASEHAGHVSSYVIARNNIIYHARLVGVSIGGYSSRVGGTDHCTIVNNTLWADSVQTGNSGNLQIQYNATNNVIGNNIMYAGPTNFLVKDLTSSTPRPASLNYNLYFSTVGVASSKQDGQGKSIGGSVRYGQASERDPHSPFADPQFLNILSVPPNLDILSTSPAVNAGVNLGSSVVGFLDYAGNRRVNGNGQINIGAYEQ